MATGGVYVTSLPPGADVWVDGSYVGQSPVLVDALAAGKHAITLTKTGWAAQELAVDIAAGGVIMSSTRLLPGSHALGGPASGTLVLRGVTDRKRLALDGAPLAADPRDPVPLAAGAHRLTLRTANGNMTVAFTIFPDTPTEVVLREPPSTGSRSAVLAAADDYLPEGSYSVEGSKIVVRYEGHVAVAHLGDTSVRYDGARLAYDAAPVAIGGKLYLPIGLLEKLTDDTSKDQ
jgi:hypothetical protein